MDSLHTPQRRLRLAFCFDAIHSFTPSSNRERLKAGDYSLSDSWRTAQTSALVAGIPGRHMLEGTVCRKTGVARRDALVTTSSRRNLDVSSTAIVTGSCSAESVLACRLESIPRLQQGPEVLLPRVICGAFSPWSDICAIRTGNVDGP